MYQMDIYSYTMYLVNFIPSLFFRLNKNLGVDHIHGASGEVCRIWSSNGTAQGAMGVGCGIMGVLGCLMIYHYMMNHYRTISFGCVGYILGSKMDRRSW